jgi:hypothetical protein
MTAYSDPFAGRAFPNSGRYATLRQSCAEVVREESPQGAAFPYTERHLRCAWFDATYRPSRLRTHDDQEVVVEEPGRWNLEAGPDFLDARLRIGPERHRLCGDVEIHVRPTDWRQHGHAADERYRRVIAHVTYFPGGLPTEDLPAGTVQIALRDALHANPAFAFETMDLTAYPFAIQESHPPCAAMLARQPPEDRILILEAAGEERLRRKAERMAQEIRAQGADQVLYRETLCALGYKSNRAPFRQLADAIPLEVLRTESHGEVMRGYALLCGVAGLLPAKAGARWDEDTRSFVRQTWDIWWKQQARWQTVIMPRKSWSLTGLRPQNHPLRRIMAAAELFAQKQGLTDILRGLRAAVSTSWNQTVMELLERSGTDGYWGWRLGLAGSRRTQPVALIGAGRATAILTNVVIPWLTAQADGESLRTVLHDLPAEEDNSLLRQTAFNLFGRDFNPALYSTGLCQQGLLQIFHDFCLHAHAGCQDCAFPRALANWDR